MKYVEVASGLSECCSAVGPRRIHDLPRIGRQLAVAGCLGRTPPQHMPDGVAMETWGALPVIAI